MRDTSDLICPALSAWRNVIPLSPSLQGKYFAIAFRAVYKQVLVSLPSFIQFNFFSKSVSPEASAGLKKQQEEFNIY